MPFGTFPLDLEPPSASSQFEGLTAFRAGPRRDPETRMLHVQSLADSGRLIQTPSSRLRCDVNTTQSIHGTAVLVPEGCANSWESTTTCWSSPCGGSVGVSVVYSLTSNLSAFFGTARRAACGSLAITVALCSSLSRL